VRDAQTPRASKDGRTLFAEASSAREKCTTKKKIGKVLVSDSNFGIRGLADAKRLGRGKVLLEKADL